MLSRNHQNQLIIGLLVFVVIGGIILASVEMYSEGERLTIAVKQGVEGVALKRIAQSFSVTYKIPVEVVELPYDALYDRELNQLKNRTEPGAGKVPKFDVMMVDDPWLPSLVFNPEGLQKSRLEELTDESWGEKKSEFFESTMEVSRYCPDQPQSCDRYYAVPFVANSQLFAYRDRDYGTTGKPISWQKVLEAQKKVESNPGRLGYVTRIGPGNSIVTDTLAILWAYEPASFPTTFKNADAALTDPAAALQTFKKLVGKWKNLGSASVDDFDVSAYLQQNRAAMGIVWSAWAMRLKKISALGGDKTNQLKFGSVPDATTGSPELGAWLLAIPTNSNRKDAAKEFIHFATRREQIAKAFLNGNPPPLKSVLAPSSKKKLSPDCSNADLGPHEIASTDQVPDEYSGLAPAIYSSLCTARARPRTPCWREVEQTFGEYLEQVLAYDDKQDWSAEKERLKILLDPVACQQKLMRNRKIKTAL